MKKSTVILAVLFTLVLVASAVGARFLLIRINDQEAELARLQSEQSEHEETVEQLNAQLARMNELNELNASLEARLRASETAKSQLDDELALAAEAIDELQIENALLDTELSTLRQHLAATGGIVNINQDSRASTMFLPQEVIELLDTFMEAISTGDEELYLSTIRGGAELEGNTRQQMMYAFETLKDVAYRITGIDAGDPVDVGVLQTGGFFVMLTAVDGSGNEINLATLISGVGVTFDQEAEKWLIYDFD